MSQKQIFKTAYGERERYFTEPGRGIIDEYGYEINKYGQKELVVTGQTDLYALIQESLEETKIENILNRVAMGDNSVMRPDGIYTDISEAPKNLIEARHQMQQLENLWNGLNNDIKREYDFSVEKFIGASGSDKWLKDMGLIKEDPKETIQSKAATPKTEAAEGGTDK